MESLKEKVSTVNTIIKHASDYLNDGIQVIPLRTGEKLPAVAWKKYQTRPQQPEDLPELFTSDRYNVGVLGGSISDNLLILDHDDPEKTKNLRSSSLFNHLLTVAPVVKTRRGFHMWMKAPDLVKSSKCGRLGVDVLSEGKYAVAPPSEVRKEHCRNQLYLFTGEKILPVYRLTPEQFTELKFLYDLKTPLETVKAGRPEAAEIWEPVQVDDIFYGLGKRFWRNIKNPAAVGSRSEQEGALVVRAASLGWTAPEIHYLFQKHSQPGSKFKEKERAGLSRQYIDAHFQSALVYIASHQTEEMKTVNELLNLLSDGVNPFTGRGAQSERAVLMTLLEYSRMTGEFNISPGYRAIADRSGVDPMQAMKAIDRLQAKNVITTEKNSGEKLIVRPGNLELIKCETLHITTLAGITLGSSRSSRSTSKISRSDLSHDVFRSRALGKQGKQIIDFLNSSYPLPWTRKLLPGTPTYLFRIIPVLEAAKIIQKVEAEAEKKVGRPEVFYQTVKPIYPEHYDSIAAAFGTLGTKERQRQRYQKDRLSWEKYKQGN